VTDRDSDESAAPSVSASQREPVDQHGLVVADQRAPSTAAIPEMTGTSP